MTLQRIFDNPEALAAIMKIEGFLVLGGAIIETITNKSNRIKDLKSKGEKTLQAKKENCLRRRRNSQRNVVKCREN